MIDNTTSEAAPERLKKRNLGKVATGGVALVAGAALAATMFSFTQPGSADFDPGAYATCNDGPLTDADIVMTPLTIGDNIAVGSFAASRSEAGDVTAPPALGDGYTPSTFTFDNRNCDVRADVRVTGVSVISDDPGSDELASNLHVYIERQGNEIYEGPLADWGGYDYVTNIPNARAEGGSLQTYKVWAWVSEDGREDISYATTNRVNLAFDVEYQITDFAESNFADDGEPDPANAIATVGQPPAASQS